MDKPEMHKKFIDICIDMAVKNVEQGKGGPFAAIVVKNNEIIGLGTNTVTSTNDPTAHAEINAIRDACKNLNSHQLKDCEIYSSCEPCPMCFSAIYWARPLKVFFAASKTDADNYGFDDSLILRQLKIAPSYRILRMVKVQSEDSNLPFEAWENKKNKIEY
jgi:guanine deaminase